MELFQKCHMLVLIPWWNLYVLNLSFLLWLLSSKTSSVQVLTSKKSTLENLFFSKSVKCMFLYPDETWKFKFSAFYVNYCVYSRQKQVLTPKRSTPRNVFFSKNVKSMFLFSDETHMFQISAFYVNYCDYSRQKQVLTPKYP